LAGQSPDVLWDLRGCLARRMNMASLAAFLSLADSIRRFSGRRQKACINYDPQVLGFLNDIGFLSVATDRDLFDWEPEDAMGGYAIGLTNPNTKVFAFPIASDPPPRSDEAAWIGWKDYMRDRLRDTLMLTCQRVFEVKSKTKSFPRQLTNLMANTLAELALNAAMWGRSLPFIAVQRSTKGITAAVCDLGRGFRATLGEQKLLGISKETETPQPQDDLSALILASLINDEPKDFGLRKAISQILKVNGWVVMSSGTGLVNWRATSWKRAILRYEQDPNTIPHHSMLFSNAPEDLLEIAAMEPGYYRQFRHKLKGVRVAFEIPFSNAGGE